VFEEGEEHDGDDVDAGHEPDKREDAE